MPQTRQLDKSCLWLLLDGLSANYLAPFGTNWMETPSLNRLVAESQTIEQATADSIDLPTGVASFLSGIHSTGVSGHPQQHQLRALLGRAAIERLLITDDVSSVRQANSLTEWDEVIEIDMNPSVNAAESIDQTHLAACFAQVMNELPRRAAPYFCVVLLTSLSKIWDAPYAMREKYVEEDDPLPPQDVIPIVAQFAAGEADPDELLGISRAYAAQIELLDQCLGVLWNELQQLGLLDNMLFGLTATRGYPLGEHGTVGHRRGLVHGEATRVPLIVRIPNSEMASARHHALAQPSFALPTVMDWFELNGMESKVCFRESLWGVLNQLSSPSTKYLALFDDAAQAIWTRYWMLADSAGVKKLYVKPDDRWEVNDVGDRRPHVVKLLSDLLNQCRQCMAENRSIDDLQLADELLTEIV